MTKTDQILALRAKHNGFLVVRLVEDCGWMDAILYPDEASAESCTNRIADWTLSCDEFIEIQPDADEVLHCY